MMRVAQEALKKHFSKPLQFQSYETLKAMIQNGQFDPELIYSETKLSRELGISRTPVRDAIQRLAQEGYLDIIPSKGFRLHRMTQKDLLNTYQIRCALEGFCAVQLAKDFESRAAARTLDYLSELLEEQQRVIDTTHSVSEFISFDWSFHEQLVAYPENETIIGLFDSIRYRIEDIAARSLQLEGRMEATLSEHTVIYENMKNGNVGRCYKAMLVHLEKPGAIIQSEMV